MKNWFTRHKLITFSLIYFTLAFLVGVVGEFSGALSSFGVGGVAGGFYPFLIFLYWLVIRGKKGKVKDNG